jgi:hypothetical protein
MFDKLKRLTGKAKDAASVATILVGDLNGDGKVDEEDARIAAEWAMKGQPAPARYDLPPKPKDVYSELSKICELNRKIVISEAEIEALRKKILDNIAH